jgi:hypothetical protein
MGQKKCAMCDAGDFVSHECPRGDGAPSLPGAGPKKGRRARRTATYENAANDWRVRPIAR